jgi:hypothetical protein
LTVVLDLKPFFKMFCHWRTQSQKGKKTKKRWNKTWGMNIFFAYIFKGYQKEATNKTNNEIQQIIDRLNSISELLNYLCSNKSLSE